MAPDRVAVECALACKKTKGKRGEGKPTWVALARKSGKCQDHQAMKSLPFNVAALLLSTFLSSHLCAQTLSRTPAPPSNAAQIEALIKKIDEQNAKIDALSQQILKLEQQLANVRPGVMIGESTPAPAATAAAATSPQSANGDNPHTVARGETLTSIAKMHGVSVSELQKFNHIENDRKLQIGQTIMIPTASSPSASSSPGE
jgi:LysM repeat protein